MITASIQKQLRSASGMMSLDLDLKIEKGSLVTLYGRSGAGKTSVLRMLAGLLQPEKGKIVVHDTTWLDTEKRINLRPQKRKVGFLFQDYALFPNMTVLQNLSFALAKGQASNIVSELIEVMELGELQNRKPNKLSGGQKQRVALARALVQRPELLLLDEPLSALDVEMRNKLQDYILQVHQHYGLTTILVSHDLMEVLKMSDELIQLEEGKIINKGNADLLLPDQDAIQLKGRVVTIEKQYPFVLSLQVGNEIIKLQLNEKEVLNLSIGDEIEISSLLVNPRIIKK